MAGKAKRWATSSETGGRWVVGLVLHRVRTAVSKVDVVWWMDMVRANRWALPPLVVCCCLFGFSGCAHECFGLRQNFDDPLLPTVCSLLPPTIIHGSMVAVFLLWFPLLGLTQASVLSTSLLFGDVPEHSACRLEQLRCVTNSFMFSGWHLTFSTCRPRFWPGLAYSLSFSIPFPRLVPYPPLFCLLLSNIFFAKIKFITIFHNTEK